MHHLVKILENKLHFIPLILFQILLTYLFYLKTIPTLAFIGGTILLAIAIPNIRIFFFLIFIILLVIPSEGYALSPVNLSISLKTLYIILPIFVFCFMLNTTMNQKKIRRTNLDLPMLFLLLWTAVCVPVGLHNGNNIELIKNDFLVLILYGMYFFIPTVIDSRKSFSALLLTIIICSGIIALEYYMIFLTHFLRGMFVRINPNQGLIYLFSLPLILATVINAELTKIKRWALIFLLAFCIGAAGITLTRSLWLSIIIALVLTAIIFHKEIKKGVIISTVLVVVMGIIVALIYLTQKTGLNIFTLVSIRAGSLLNIGQDITMNQRLLTYQVVWEQILKSPIFGQGLGKQYTYSYLGTAHTLFWADNSYLMLLWKLGIVGTITFLWIIAKSLMEARKIFKMTGNKEFKIYSGAMMSFLIAWIILGSASPQMFKYLLNIVWITLIALINNIKSFPNENNDSNL